MTGCGTRVYYSLVWKCFILIRWLVFAIFEQFMLNFGNAVTRLCLAMGTMAVGNDFLWRPPVEYIFPRYFFYIFGKYTACTTYIVCCQHENSCQFCDNYYNGAFECVYFSCMSKMRCYLINILLTSTSGTIHHQTTL